MWKFHCRTISLPIQDKSACIQAGKITAIRGGSWIHTDTNHLTDSSQGCREDIWLVNLLFLSIPPSFLYLDGAGCRWLRQSKHLHVHLSPLKMHCRSNQAVRLGVMASVGALISSVRYRSMNTFLGAGIPGWKRGWSYDHVHWLHEAYIQVH